MSRRARVVKESGEAVFALLKLTSATADAFPPLKSAAGGALHIADLVVQFKSNKKEWASFAQYIKDTLACIIRFLPDVNLPRGDLTQNMNKLNLVLEQMLRDIATLQDDTPLTRFWTFVKDPNKIADMRKEYDDVLSLFHLGAAITTGIVVESALKGLDIRTHLDSIFNKFGDNIVRKIKLNSSLDILPYAEGASWSPIYVCAPNTRVVLLEDIWEWAGNSEPGAKRIFWLCDVAGSGKSAVAHTFAQQCHAKGLLASSFFFDREIFGRSGPQKLFSTIARDLAGLYPNISEDVAVVLEEERSIASASLTRQFKSLILEPSRRCIFTKPVIIIIDALDECDEDSNSNIYTELLHIFRDQVPKLPEMFHIFLTSRPKGEFDEIMSQQGLVLLRSINILAPANLNDIEVYVQLKLKELGRRGKLGENWPDQSLANDFTRRGEGLFIWVSTVCNYIGTTIDPNAELKLLISQRSPQGLPAEEKMDKLYVTILKTCNWRDNAFVHGYRLVMGTIMAAKSPLSMSALQSLHGDNLQWPVETILQPLGSLLTGLTAMDHHPVRILHQSFRDFVTSRAGLSSDSKQFSLSVETYNQHMALLCIKTLNRELTDNIAGTGYLAADNDVPPGIPEISEITEALLYACKFWVDHIVEVRSPVANELIAELHNLSSMRLVLWMEIISSKGRFPGLGDVCSWYEMFVGDCLFDADSQTSAIFELSTRLHYMDRQEEALIAIQEAVVLHQQLAADQPAAFDPVLAISLDNLSNCLSDLGHREDALTAIQKAVELHHKLAADQPVAFNLDLAISLNNLSNCLSDLGHHEDALMAIQEAIKLYQKLAADQPVAFNKDLARSLNNLSVYLSHLGRREDALTAIQEAVVLYRNLVADQPAAFSPDLAMSLNNLSIRLSDLGHREDALMAIQEAVVLYRKHAADRPVAFNLNLAGSLNNLSNRLSDLGCRGDALTTIQEAVKLYQKLAEDRPMAFNPYLATSLNNLSNCLSNLGRPEDALMAIQEAVELRRKLAADRPMAFNSDLAMSLNNLSSHLSNMGYREDALTAIQEAVEFGRKIEADQPAAFNPNLARSLINLSSCLSNLGCQEDALTAIQEAVELYRNLVADQPAAFSPDLAMSLNHLSVRLSDLGHQEDALTAIQEAIELYQKLATDLPVTFNPYFATSLNNLSNCLSDLGCREDALMAIKEAVEFGRKLAADQPAAFNLNLARFLNNLSIRLSDLGCREDALTTIQEAVKIGRKLATDQPAAFNLYLARFLNNLSIRLSDLGHQEDALMAIQEAVEFGQKLAADQPAAFNPDLTRFLNNLSDCLFNLGHQEADGNSGGS